MLSFLPTPTPFSQVEMCVVLAKVSWKKMQKKGQVFLKENPSPCPHLPEAI